ncbi:MAG TPA: nuclear transport factor 2 family protein [Gemmatimonadaceae bacterium]|nr:nuclear transport factor 2 family protein [Gemmatimonadaceae bacterium]
MRLSVFALLATLVVAPLADASAQASRASRQLFRLEDAWAAALVKRDSSFFRRTLHADYVYSDERGTFTKAQVIAEQVGGTDTVTAASNEDMRAHVHGTAAVVTGILIVSGRGKDGPFAHRYRYTDTWVNDKKGWVMIASQDYEIPRR